jgi:hypothetical protein
MKLVQRPMNGVIISLAGGLFTFLGLGLAGGAWWPQYYVAPFLAAGVVLAAAPLMYWRPNRHTALGAAIIVSSLAVCFIAPILRESWMFGGRDLLAAALRSVLVLIGALLGVVGGGLAMVWRPGADILGVSTVSEPGEQKPERDPRTIQRALRDSARLAAFALWFWGLYQRSFGIPYRYYGPIFFPFWVIFGLAAIANSILLVARAQYRLAWGLIIVVVSFGYSILVAVEYAFVHSLTLSEAILYGTPGVLAVLGAFLGMTWGAPPAGRGGHRPPKRHRLPSEVR